MASATSWSEEDFSCSICLDVFNSPVSTPCGHNFCRTCITTFWDDQVQHKCPVCNALFHTRPDLQVNTFISGMVDRFRSYVLVKEPPCVDVGEVLCDVCTGPQLKALKSCLMCFMSYCQTHLEPHQRVARLKTHLLVNAMDRLEDRMCKKHNRLLELFCQTEQVCVCLFCTEGLHRSHPVVPLKEEYEVKTAQLGKIEAEVQHMIQERQRKIQEIKDTVDRIKADADRELADGVKVLTALKRSVEKYQDDLNHTVKEKLKSTEKEAEGLIEELEQEIADLTNRRSEVKRLSHTEDHLHLIQTFRSLKDPPPTRDWTMVEVLPPSYVGTLRRSLEQLEATLNMEMKKLPDLKPDGKKSSRHGHEHGRAAPPPAGEGAAQDHHQHVPGRGRAAEQGGADLEADVKKATRAGGGEVEDPEHLKTQELFKRVRSVLNKLTPQMFQPLMKQVRKLQIDTEERLNGVTGLIFEKAISEPNFSVVYANMCRCLTGLKVRTTHKPGQTVNFRKLMLNRCQEKFEKDKDNDEFFEKKQKELEAASEGEKQKLKDTLEEAKDEAHRRQLGNIKFIGELFKLKMLTEAIMHDCIVTLLKKHGEGSRESLCWLLSTIGKELDHRKAKPRMDQYFNMMKKIMEERKTTSRIRFMLQDVLDLRRNLWVPRRVKQGPKTIDQIHKDAELEENREQMKRAILFMSSGGDRMGGRGERGEEEEEDEWEEGEDEEEVEGYAF